MATKIHQHTKLPTGINSVKIKNNFPKKHIRIKNLPRGSKVHVGSSFVMPETLSKRMSEIKASHEFKSGEIKAKSEYQRIKVRKDSKLKVNIS